MHRLTYLIHCFNTVSSAATVYTKLCHCRSSETKHYGDVLMGLSVIFQTD